MITGSGMDAMSDDRKRGLVLAALLFGIAALAVITSADAANACEAIPASPGRLTHVTARLRQNQPLRVLIIGSSTSSGLGASAPERAYPAVFARRFREMKRGVQLSLSVAGFDGDITSGILQKFRSDISGRLPLDLVVWQSGINDAISGEDEQRFAAVMSSVVQAVAGANADLLLIDQPFLPDVSDPARYERYVATYDKAGESEGFMVLGRYKAMKALRSDPVRLGLLFSPDRLHLSNEGHRCLGEALAEALARAIGR